MLLSFFSVGLALPILLFYIKNQQKQSRFIQSQGSGKDANTVGFVTSETVELAEVSPSNMVLRPHN